MSINLNAASRLSVRVPLEDQDLLAACLEVTAGPHGVADETYMDFNKILGMHLVPVVNDAKRQIAAAVKVTVPRLKAWALLHLQQAQKLKRPTDLFEKVLNDPQATTQQLAARLLGDLGSEAACAIERRVSERQEDAAIDDVLKDIGL